ncbi:DUF2569 domain-containing protein [Phyllobacterium sp. LjRoot231]|uniref:DUF2569 domain-containing protein n=1 Tax=Phyllobacterium sp. LjRoot231 TaxID=3342289 RepID=UPI003ECC4EB0
MTETTMEPELTGIRGWLALMALGMVFGPLRTLVQTIDRNYTGAEWDSFARHSYSALLVAYGETLIGWLIVLLVFAVTGLFFMKSRHFPKAYIVVVLFSLVYTIVDLVVVSIVFDVEIDTLISTEIFAPFAFSASWIAYLTNSRRVANTFVK